MKRALITGITGQVGSHMADFLLDKGYEVHGIARRISKPTSVRPEVKLHSGDLCDQFSLAAILKEVKPHEVYNFAAQSFVFASWSQPVLTGDSTALGVTRMLEAIRHTWPEARFYQASSSEMFGKVRETPQTELTPFHPRSPYGCAKAYGHQITVNYRESFGLFAVSGICFNAEGPRRGKEFVTRKITSTAAAISRGEQKELVLGNLEARRDWGYAGDYVDAMWRMLQQDEPRDYVIATGVQHSVAEFCAAAFGHANLDWTKFVRTDRQFKRPAEVDLLVGNAKKLSDYTGWKPTVTFRNLVAMMVDADVST